MATNSRLLGLHNAFELEPFEDEYKHYKTVPFINHHMRNWVLQKESLIGQSIHFNQCLNECELQVLELKTITLRIINGQKTNTNTHYTPLIHLSGSVHVST